MVSAPEDSAKVLTFPPRAEPRAGAGSGAPGDPSTEPGAPDFGRGRGDADAQRLIDAANEGIWTIDLEGRTTFVNERMAALLGYSADDMIGRVHTEFMWEEDRPRGNEDLEARRRGTRAVWDQRYRRQDGTELWTIASCSSLYDDAGQVVGALGMFTDISDRKRAERELRDSQQMMSVAMRAARAGAWSWDARSNEIVWSAEQYALFGLDSRQPVTVEQWDGLVHPADRERMHRFADELRSSPKDCQTEYRILTPAGERWLLVVGHLERDAHGDAVRYVGMNLDITDRKVAEATIRASEVRYRALADSTPDAFAAFDRALRYVYWNRAAETLTGRGSGEVLGKTRSELWGDTDTVRETDERLRECMATGTAQSLEMPALEPARAPWIHVRMVPMPDGVAAFFRDISREKAAEQTLRALYAQVREEKNRLSLVLDNIAEEVWFHDAEGRLVLANPTAQGALGMAAGQQITQLADHAGRRGPDGRAVPFEETPIARALAGEEVRDFEEIVQRPGSGEWRTRWVTSVPARGPDGEILGVVSVVRDVTDAKRIEAELRATGAALRDSDRRKDEFLATLAHELRNPLAPIRTLADILSKLNPEGGRLEWAQQVLERQATHMARLLDDLLDVARITQGRFTLQLEWTPLARIVEAAVDSARPQLEERKHHLTISLPAEPIFLQADPVRLAQVLSNLLTNAAKYTDPGGEITLIAQQQDGALSLSVRDTGIGIPAESLTRIFEMFAQIDADSPRSAGGLGIGLALVRGIVGLHGGTVEARSAGVGAGSEFRVTLPTPSGTRGRSSSDSGAPPRPVPPRRIVLADDNEDAADSLAILLELSGHAVRVAYGGTAALELVRAFVPEVVILDIGMPDRNGYEVAAALRSDPGGGDLFLIALTGWGQDVNKQEASRAGFDAHLTKPADHVAIDALLRDIGKR